MPSHYFSQKTDKRGFTLIELLVASSVFGLLILIVTGIFLNIVYAHRKAEAVRLLQDSTRFVTEALSRDVRTGLNFNLRGDQTELCFDSTISSAGIQRVSYRWQNFRIQRGSCNDDCRCDNACICNYEDLTPVKVRVGNFKFYFSGLPQKQPRITVVLGAAAGQGLQETKINIQTTLSQRELYQP